MEIDTLEYSGWKLQRYPCAYGFICLRYQIPTSFLVPLPGNGSCSRIEPSHPHILFHFTTMLAVDINDFCRQRSAWFHEIKSIIMPNSLILTSSTSFVEYLNAGTQCAKTGEIPRPAGQPTQCGVSCPSFDSVSQITKPSQFNLISFKIPILRSKGLSQGLTDPHAERSWSSSWILS